MNYLDYIIIAIFIFYGLWGLAKGILRIVLDLVGYVVAVIVAKLASPLLITYLNGTSFYGNVHNKIYDTFSRISPELGRSIETLKIPDSLSEMVQQEPGLRSVLHSYPKLQSTIEANMNSLYGRGFMEVVTEYMMAIISILAIFVFVKIIFSLVVSVILSRQDQLPLAITNRIFGMVFGCLVALFLVTFTLQLVEVYSMASSPVLLETISHSKYGHMFTSIPLLDFMTKLIN